MFSSLKDVPIEIQANFIKPLLENECPFEPFISQSVNQEKNITFLISSHILSELSLIATKYGIISKGQIIKEISNNELQHEYLYTFENNCIIVSSHALSPMYDKLFMHVCA